MKFKTLFWREANRFATRIIALLLISFSRAVTTVAAAPAVLTVRVPDSGVQPQASVDEKGAVRLIYLTGDPSHSDIFFAVSIDGAKTFSKSMRVNSQPGSAVSMGTVRGAHLAIGKGGRVHVAWMGSSLAEPKAVGKQAPMLYARLSDDGTARDLPAWGAPAVAARADGSFLIIY